MEYESAAPICHPILGRCNEYKLVDKQVLYIIISVSSVGVIGMEITASL